MSKTVVYFVLGCKSSGRFQVVSDLIEFGTDKGEKTLVLHSSADEGSAADNFLVKSREAERASYEIVERKLVADLPEDTEYVFVIADGLSSPADSVEAFHGWLADSSCDLGCVITVLHSELAVGDKSAFPWFDCCIHYTDIVLLSRRENVSNKDMKVLLDRYVEKCYPCLFEYVKKGRVSNPSLVLGTPARRISRVFDVPEIFEDDEDEDIFEEAAAGDLVKDIYQNRITGGRREIVLPNIADHL